LQIKDKVYWHEAFVEAIKLELDEYKDSLEFVDEYTLSEQALKVDVIVIKKKPGQKIDKNIGVIFKAHNLFEYKSETDYLSIWDYNKIIAYAFLYSAFNQVPVSEITLSFAVTTYPRDLLNIWKKSEVTLSTLQKMGFIMSKVNISQFRYW